MGRVQRLLQLGTASDDSDSVGDSVGDSEGDSDSDAAGIDSEQDSASMDDGDGDTGCLGSDRAGAHHRRIRSRGRAGGAAGAEEVQVDQQALRRAIEERLQGKKA